MGEIPQDLKYAGERTRLVIGRNCRIRENATLHSGTEHGGGITRMGDNCLVMAGAHVGHDAQIGNNVILANYAGIAGHVVIEDNVIVGALSGIHQFVRIGEGAIIGGVSRVTHDVMPFGMVASSDGTLNGLNLIGLKRRGMAREDIAALREAYRTLADTDAPLVEAARDLGEEAQSDAVRKLAAFFTTASGRSFFASAMTRTALIAGRGDLPELVAARLALEGLPPVLAELEGFESLSLAREGVERFRLERLVPFLDRLVDLGVTRAVFAGGVHRPRLDPALLDPATMQLLPRIMAAMGQGDDGALREVIALMGEWGIDVVGVQDICPELLPAPGQLGAHAPKAQDRKDIARGFEILHAMGAADVGARLLRGARSVSGHRSAARDRCDAVASGQLAR